MEFENFNITEPTREDEIKMNALAKAGVRSIWDFEKKEISLRDGDRLEDIEKIINDGVLNHAKLLRKKYIVDNKNRYINRPVETSKGLFFGGIEAMSQYESLQALGTSLGLTEGNVPSVNGVVVCTEADMDEIIKLLRTQNYNGTVKMFYYYNTIDACSTVEEVEAVVWEDVRSG